MNYKCNKCETDFEAGMAVQCPNCKEMMDVTPIYKYARANYQNF